MSFSKESWERTIQDLLRRYQNGWEPFTTQSLYLNEMDPWDNDALNAKIDIERGLEKGCKDAEELVEFLHCTEEGWFFEGKAEFFELLGEYLAQRRTLPRTVS